jgi:hypothetical protein
MAVAALAISVVAGLAGSMMQMSAMNAQADAQEKIAAYNNQEKITQANREQAAGHVRAELEQREAQAVAAKARAGMAQSGMDTTSGTPLLLDSEIIREGAFRSNIELADAQNKERTLKEAGKIDLFEGKIRAASSRSQAKASLLSGIGSAFGSVANYKFG